MTPAERQRVERNAWWHEVGEVAGIVLALLVGMVGFLVVLAPMFAFLHRGYAWWGVGR